MSPNKPKSVKFSGLFRLTVPTTPTTAYKGISPAKAQDEYINDLRMKLFGSFLVALLQPTLLMLNITAPTKETRSHPKQG